MWQHLDCLGIAVDNQPQQFFCEYCRAASADPFWEVMNARVLPSAKLIPSGGMPMRGPGGVNEMQQVLEKAFQVSQSQIHVLKRNDTNHQLQVLFVLKH